MLSSSVHCQQCVGGNSSCVQNMKNHSLMVGGNPRTHIMEFPPNKRFPPTTNGPWEIWAHMILLCPNENTRIDLKERTLLTNTNKDVDIETNNSLILLSMNMGKKAAFPGSRNPLAHIAIRLSALNPHHDSMQWGAPNTTYPRSQAKAFCSKDKFKILVLLQSYYSW